MQNGLVACSCFCSKLFMHFLSQNVSVRHVAVSNHNCEYDLMYIAAYIFFIRYVLFSQEAPWSCLCKRSVIFMMLIAVKNDSVLRKAAIVFATIFSFQVACV